MDAKELPPKISQEINLHDMTFAEIQKLIWKDIPVYVHISLRDRFTDDALHSLVQHPCLDDFPRDFKTWLWNALDAMYLAEKEAA